MVKCRICGELFELEADPYMWTPRDQCKDCHSKVLSGKIIPVVKDGEIIAFHRKRVEMKR